MRGRGFLTVVAAGVVVLSSLVGGITSAVAETSSTVDADQAEVFTGSISGKVTWPKGYEIDREDGIVGTLVVDVCRFDVEDDRCWGYTGAFLEDDGSYIATGLPAGERFGVFVRSAVFTPNGLLTTVHGGFGTTDGEGIRYGWLDWEQTGVDLVTIPDVGGSVTDVNIDMVKAPTIQGTVFLMDGSPVADGMRVTCWAVRDDGTADTSIGMYTHTVSDLAEDGSYSCEAVPGRTYRATATVDGYQQANEVMVTAPSAGETVSGQDIHLSGVEEEVNLVPDAGLRQCIAKAMHRAGTGASPGHPDYATEADSISQADLDALAAASTEPYQLLCGATNFQVNPGVASLEGLQYLHDPEFTTLVLDGQDVENLSPISGLVGLEVLRLGGNRVADLSPLSGLVNLQELDISGNQIMDISAVKSLTNLEKLSMGRESLYNYNYCQGSSSESDCGETTDNNRISDVSVLSFLTKLETLSLQGNEVSALNFPSLANLQIVNAADNKISSIDLSGSTQMIYLNLSGNQVSDLSSLTGLSELSDLLLDGNRVSDLTPLAGLTKLKRLSLADNEISDVSVVGSLNELTDLTLGGNHVTDVSMINLVPLAVAEYWCFAEAGWSDRDGGAEWERPTELTWVEVQTSGFDPTLPTVCSYGGIGEQVVATVATAGASVVLPSVSPASTQGELEWEVVSGNALLNGDGTVTYPSAGDVTLAWTSVLQCDPNAPTGQFSCSEVLSQNGSVDQVESLDLYHIKFTGTVMVTVTEPVEGPLVPSAPDSSVAVSVGGSVTGGAARLADGVDAFDLVVTVNDGAGQPVIGVADRLAVSAPGLTVGVVSDQRDGTYVVVLSSSESGVFPVSVSVDGTPIGQPLSLGFIEAVVESPVVAQGGVQQVTASGFTGGEEVCLLVHPQPWDCGCVTADDRGVAVWSLTLPAGFEVGEHRAVATGESSGTVQVSFRVAQTTPVLPVVPPLVPEDPVSPQSPVTPGGSSTVSGGSAGSLVVAPTGGTAMSAGGLPLMVGAMMVLAGALVRRVRSRV